MEALRTLCRYKLEALKDARRMYNLKESTEIQVVAIMMELYSAQNPRIPL